MSLSITNTLWILSLPSLPNSVPHALRLGGTLGDHRADFSEVPSSTSSRLGRLQQSNLISCSAALQMTPGSWTKTRNGDALMGHNSRMIRAGKGPAQCADWTHSEAFGRVSRQTNKNDGVCLCKERSKGSELLILFLSLFCDPTTVVLSEFLRFDYPNFLPFNGN